ncbi:MAG: TonB-dependent receptor [Acidobacteria bacterium]|nr:TonB-dependent receptor [Acidobacteriota bacterium]
MNKSRIFIFALVAALFLSVGAFAQEQAGAIGGVVADKDGAALPGATVEATGPQGTMSVITDVDGSYSFPRLPSGRYKIAAKLDGFVTAEVPGVDLTLGRSLKVNFTLQPGSFEEAITVAAENVVIDVTKSQTAVSIRREDLELLPRGRDFTSVVAQAAGASDESFLGGISIDGASGSENRFIMDGVDTTHPQDGVSGQNMVTDFIEEVQVKTAGYNAEYGGSLGGVINAITKSGGNEFHGWVGAYYTDSSWNGSQRPTPYASDPTLYKTYNKDDQTRMEPGFSLGGPILRDKLWFYLGYQPTIVSTERNPLNTTETFPQDETYHYFTGNIKGNIGSSFIYKFAANLSPSTTENTLPNQDGTTPATADLAVDTDRERESYSLYADFIPTSNFLVSGRVGYFKSDLSTTGNYPASRIWFRSGTNASGPYPGGPSDPLYRPVGFATSPAQTATDMDLWTRKSAGLDATVFFNALGSHAVKFGLNYELIENEVATGEPYNLFEVRWGRPDRFGAGVIGTYGSVHVRRFGTFGAAESTNYAVFLQDSWQVAKNFTVNYGIRAEQERVPNYGAAADPSLPKNAIEFDFQDKLAPRLGFAWDVMSDQRLKVYGDYGEYYDITKLEMPRGSFGGDKWIAYLYPIETLDWTTLANGCTLSTNNPADNPCPLLGTPVTRDLRAPTDPATAIDPELKPMQNREFQLGAEYQLNVNSMVGVRYVNKTLVNTIEDVGFLVCDDAGTCHEEYWTANPGKGMLTDPNIPDQPVPQAEAIRDYQALELSYNRRFADNWSLRASYTYSELTGNYSGLASSDEFGRTDPNVARYFDGLVFGYDQNGKINDGPLNTDRPHAVELQGIYRFPWNMSLGVNTSWRSGTATSTTAFYNGVDFFPNGRNDMGRTPNLTQTDLFIAQPFKIGSFGFEVNLNVTNLFDEDTVTRIYNYAWTDDICDHAEGCDYSNEYYFNQLVPYNASDFMGDPYDPENPIADEFYGKDYAWQAARVVRLGLKFTF